MAKTGVHKDFHGALSFALQHLESHYGRSEMEAYLRQVARAVYGPLSKALRRRGLRALEEHWRQVYEQEEGLVRIERTGNRLKFHVERCPAIHHMKERGYPIAEHFCESTRIINEEVCRAAGFCASVRYDQHKGTCVQEFWKEGGP